MEIMNVMDVVWCVSVILSSVGYGNGPTLTIRTIFEMFLMFSGAIIVAATTTAWLTKEKKVPADPIQK